MASKKKDHSVIQNILASLRQKALPESNKLLIKEVMRYRIL
jgi:hypothetical protein